MTTLFHVTLNARLRPNDRCHVYEDPLQRVLDRRHPGSEVTGGGTMLGATGEVAWCDLDIELVDDAETGAVVVIDFLEWMGAPIGSVAWLGDGEPRAFGRAEGLGVYLNGYGGSASSIRSAITPVLDTYPLATRCRVVDLPNALPAPGGQGSE